MKVIRIGKAVQLCLLTAVILLIVCGVSAAARCLAGVRQISAAAYTQGEDDRVRAELLREAIEQLGVCDPTEAASIWASGLQKRSAALQYAVMSADLQAEYRQRLSKSAPNWVTGISSPWVDAYQITSVTEPSGDTRIIQLIFTTATSTGIDAEYGAELQLAQEGDFWRITQIQADEGLYPYM